jgi:hypothetical protein
MHNHTNAFFNSSLLSNICAKRKLCRFAHIINTFTHQDALAILVEARTTGAAAHLSVLRHGDVSETHAPAEH